MSSVYAHLDRHGHVLYVGCTYNLEKRTVEHRRSSWWPLVDSVQIVAAGLPDKAARDLERRLIETFNPPHNRMFTAAWRAQQRPTGTGTALEPVCSAASAREASPAYRVIEPSIAARLVTGECVEIVGETKRHNFWGIVDGTSRIVPLAYAQVEMPGSERAA